MKKGIISNIIEKIPLLTAMKGMFSNITLQHKNVEELELYRKQAEEKLQLSEERFRTMFEEAPLGIALIDSLTGHIYVVNSRFVQIVGRTREEMVTIDWMSITHPYDVQEDLDNMADLTAGKIDGFNMEKRYIKPDGSNVWIHMTIAPMTVMDKKKPRHLCMIDDITKRKQEEKELEKHRNHLEELVLARTTELQHTTHQKDLILSAAGEGIYGFDLEGRCIFINPVGATMLGYQNDELIGKPHHYTIHHTLVDGTPYPREDSPVSATLKDAKVYYTTDEYFWRKDGSSFPVEYTSTPIIENGSIRGAVITFKDITKQKQSAQLLVDAKAQAERANQAKSTFLANMSHEIRTPMNAVLGFAEILIGKEHDSQKRHYVESIHTGGKALLSLINDILDLSKIEAGKMELQYSALSISGLFQEMKTIFDWKITDKGVKFIVESSEELPEALILDETRLRQILINLLGNAVKFTDEGHIRLAAFSRYSGDESRSRVNLVLEVEDTGVGIPRYQQEKIFDAFEQVVGRKTSQAGGTGLGLAITRNLVAMMDGEISVSSEQGKGSTFRVTLHDVEIAASRSLKEHEEKAIDFNAIAFEQATVLIADDIDYNREMLAVCLNGWDFNIIFAVSGREVIDMASKHHPDLILLDMKMPEMDGYEASNIMKEDDKLKNIPVIAITASAMRQDEELISRICDGYLRKPVSRIELVREVMKYLPHTIKEVKEEAPIKETTPADIVFPPPEQIKKLLEAAKMGSVTDLKESISEIREMDFKYQSLADMVEAWGRKYAFEKIIELLEKNTEETK